MSEDTTEKIENTQNAEVTEDTENEELLNKKRKKRIKRAIRYIIALFVVMGRSFVTYMFQSPNGFAPGGVSGIAVIIQNILVVLGKEPSFGYELLVTLIIMGLNIPLLILAWIFVNKKYTLSTLLSVIFYAGAISIFPLLHIPQFTFDQGNVGTISTDFNMYISYTGIKFLAALMGGILDGFFLGMLFRLNSSAGGTEIISMIIYKKKPSMNIAWILFIIDFAIAACSGLIGITTVISTGATDTTEILVRVVSPIMFSSVALFMSSKVADSVNTGFDTSFVFNIVTTKPTEICDVIFRKIHRGATILEGEGAYTKEEKKIVVCIVTKKQSAVLKKIAKNVDENSFTYIMRANEVRGKGFDGKAL